EQPAVALSGVLAPLDEHRLGNGVADGKQILAEPLAIAVDMDDAGKSAKQRLIRIGAGVPAVSGGKSGAAIVDAREFAGEIVEIGLREAVGVTSKIEGPPAIAGARLFRIGRRAVGMVEQRRFLELHDVGNDAATFFPGVHDMKDPASLG